jgi:transposase, IS30 family
MKKRESFRHLTQKDRDRIHGMYRHGYDQKTIAEVLGVNPATISRELKRYPRKTYKYSAIAAQKDADIKRSHSKTPGMKIEAHLELRQYIIKQIQKLRSPDEIAGRMKKKGVIPRASKNAIYKWLYSPHGSKYCRFLCTKRVRKKKQSRLGKKIVIPDRISFKHRPILGIHAERDLFVSPKNSHSTASGMMIVIPEAKLFSGSIIPNRKPNTVDTSILQKLKHLHIDTFLADNGIENIHHTKLPVPSYFCDRGSPWQKPHIEGGIGLVRRWFIPKGTNLSTVPDELFQSQLHLLNHKYRKSLGYKSAYEVALERGIIKRVPKQSLSKAIAFR